MENVSKTSSSFVLLGLVEMESMKYVYIVLALVVYLNVLISCTVIVFAIWTEDSLHEPMYFFICNLIFNDSFVSTILFPKLIIDLISGNKIIYISTCVTQAFCIHTFACVEILTFTFMAHDRYLAVGQPLRYHTIMPSVKVRKYIAIIWVLSFIIVSMPIFSTAMLPFCGLYIKNIFCENMSLVKLACSDTTINNMFGAVQGLLIIVCCLLLIIYCYIRTFLICLKISKDACGKAIHTLTTHLISYSCFMVTSLFLVLRYRLNSNTTSIAVHILLSVSGLIIPSTFNPLIYGIRTENLKIKIVQNLKKIPKHFCNH